MKRLLSREFFLALLIAAAACWFAFQYVQPAPPKSFVIASASKGSPYYDLVAALKQYITENGVDVSIRETGGSFDNLKALRDPTSDVQAAMVQGGLTNKNIDQNLRSLGRLLAEPVWIFYAGPEKLDRITQLKGKRILVGPEGGAVNYLSRKLLDANGITDENSTLVSMQMPDYIDALSTGKADAGFLVLGAEARTVQRLLRLPNVHLMSMSQADGLTQRFPYLAKLTLRQGVVDFAANIPAEDTTLVSTEAALLVRDDLHPALVNLLAQAVGYTLRQPTLTPSGEAKLFPLSADALTSDDPEFPMAAEARRAYTTGAPFLQKYLPFWLATLLDRTRILILPLLGVILPLIRLVPMLYNWRMRRRILYWYRQLKNLERDLPPSASKDVIETKELELARIDEGVQKISVPLQYSVDLYNLRGHVETVQKRIAQMKERALAAAARQQNQPVGSAAMAG